MKKRVKIFLAVISIAVLFSFLIPLQSLRACEEPPPPPPDEEVCVDVDMDVTTDAQQTLEVTKEIELVEDGCEEDGIAEEEVVNSEENLEATEEEAVLEESIVVEEPCDLELDLEEGESQDIEETIIVEVVDPITYVPYFIDVDTIVKNEHCLNIVFVDDLVTSIFMEEAVNPGFWLLVEEVPVYTDEWFDGVPGNGDDIILAGCEKTYSLHKEYYYLYGSIINWKAESVVYTHTYQLDGWKIEKVDAVNEDEDCEESPQAAAPEPIDIIDFEYFDSECQDVATFEITDVSVAPDYMEQDGKTARLDFYEVTGPKEIKIWKTIYGEKCGTVALRNDVWSSLNCWEEPVDSAKVCIEVTCPPEEPKPEEPKEEPKEEVTKVATATVEVIEEVVPIAELPYTGMSPIIPFAGIGLIISGLGLSIGSLIRRRKK